MKEKALVWLDRLLVVNAFVVLLGFAWFAIALVGKSFNIPLGLDLWFSLWQPVFTPAIGLLMGSIILTSGVKQVLKYWQRAIGSEES
jgi:hypothetical protein